MSTQMWKFLLCCLVIGAILWQSIECKKEEGSNWSRQITTGASDLEDLVRKGKEESLLSVGNLSPGKRPKRRPNKKSPPVLMRNYQQLPSWLQREVSKWWPLNSTASPNVGAPANQWGQCSRDCIWFVMPDIWSKKAVRWWSKRVQNLQDNIVATGASWLTGLLPASLPIGI